MERSAAAGPASVIWDDIPGGRDLPGRHVLLVSLFQTVRTDRGPSVGFRRCRGKCPAGSPVLPVVVQGRTDQQGQDQPSDQYVNASFPPPGFNRAITLEPVNDGQISETCPVGSGIAIGRISPNQYGWLARGCYPVGLFVGVEPAASCCVLLCPVPGMIAAGPRNRRGGLPDR